ncbi:MAG TPA: helicase SNF2 [Candidatus Bathyarchaeota archaeon]|nr:helicase SNF2 [Candidatus Bathyarchaeota archaeon]
MPSFSQSFNLKDHLYLARFIAQKLGIKDLTKINDFKDIPEGYHTDGYSYMYHHLLARPGRLIRETTLREYDNNIREYLQKLNKKRITQITLKYYQYLALLFTEIYLDLYFQDPIKLLNELNNFYGKEIDQYKFYDEKNLHKIAYWMATGSGKTFILHINIWQFQKYNKGKHKIDYNNILLITANDDMTKQHLEDITQSGINAEAFDGTKLAYYFGDKDTIKVLSIHKLTEEKTGTGVTIDIASFTTKNIVLVDEGHKGKASKDSRKWTRIKNQIAKNGFTFEYSATFGQIIDNEKDPNFQEYSESIIFDYSYKYFHNDGYGKHYKILNIDLKKEFDTNYEKTLLLANAMSFYEQTTTYNQTPETREYNIKKPLWIFIGSKVSGKTTRSDIITVIDFLNYLFTTKKGTISKKIEDILNGESGIKTPQGEPLFKREHPERHFPYLRQNEAPEQIYKGIFQKIFNVDPDSTGTKLHFVDLRESDGEIGLKASSGAEFFGVINISNSLKNQVKKEIENKYPDIIIDEDRTQKSLFNIINQKTDVNILIGAKKFIEGWNSWRVSNMCLLNIGKSEGPQIIQLFGRGVRLKGKNNTLKRTNPADNPPQYLPLLETLNIYGIKANYMLTFKEIIEKEDIPTHTIELETKIIEPFPDDLLVLKISDNWDFYQETFPLEISDKIRLRLDLRPMGIEIDSQTPGLTQKETIIYDQKIKPEHIQILDWNEIYLNILQYKKLKEYYNLSINKETLIALIKNPDNYTLLCNETEVTLKEYSDIEKIKKLILLLLQKYIDLFYRRKRNAAEKENIYLVPIKQDDPNIEQKYMLQIQTHNKNVINYIEKLLETEQIYKSSKQIQLPGDLRTYIMKNPIQFRNAYYQKHLYQPLLINENKDITLIPSGLNEGEAKFVDDLVEYLNKNPINDKEIYLLRNSTKSKGIGFYAEHSFYPDFIMWIKNKDQQKILFIDPKGLTHIEFDQEKDEQKLSLHKHLKNEIQPKLNNNKVSLDAYTISVTEWKTVKDLSDLNLSIPEFAKKHHILFQYKDRIKDKRTINDDYVNTLFDIALSTI